MDFHSMKRKELQALCKKHKIPANLSNLEMATKLEEFFREKGRSLTQGLINEHDENAIEIEAADVVMSRRVKKVRFSPDHEIIEFTREKKRRSRRTLVSSRNSSSAVENVDSGEVNNEGVGGPGRLTRSRGSKLMEGEVIEKKKGRKSVNQKTNRAAIENFNSGDSREGDVYSLGGEMQDRGELLVEGVKNPRKGGRKRASDVDGRDEKVLHDSNNESIHEIVNNPGRVTRSRGQKLMKASTRKENRGRKDLENNMVSDETNENGVFSKTSFRSRGIVVEEKLAMGSGVRVKNNGKDSKECEEVMDNKESAGLHVMVEPQILLRRSKRNAAKVGESVISNDDTMKQETGVKGLRKTPKLLAAEGSGVVEESAGSKVYRDGRAILQIEEPVKLHLRRSNRRKNVIASHENGNCQCKAETENGYPLTNSVLQLGTSGGVSKENEKPHQPAGITRRSRRKSSSLNPVSVDENFDTDTAVKISKNGARKRRRGPISGGDVRKTDNDPISLKRSMQRESRSEKAEPSAAISKVADEMNPPSRWKEPNMDASSHESLLEIGELSSVDAQLSMTEVAESTITKNIVSEGLTSSGKTHTEVEDVTLADNAGSADIKLINGNELENSDENAAPSIAKLKTDSGKQISYCKLKDVEKVYSFLDSDVQKLFDENISDTDKNDPEVQLSSQTQNSSCNNTIVDQALLEVSNVCANAADLEVTEADMHIEPCLDVVDHVVEVEGVPVQENMESAATENANFISSSTMCYHNDVESEAEADKGIEPSLDVVDHVVRVEGIPVQEHVDSAAIEQAHFFSSSTACHHSDVESEVEADKYIEPSLDVVDHVAKVEGVHVQENMDSAATEHANLVSSSTACHHSDVDHLEASNIIFENNNEDTPSKLENLVLLSLARHVGSSDSKSALQLKEPSSDKLGRSFEGDNTAEGDDTYFHKGIDSELTETDEGGCFHDHKSASNGNSESTVPDVSNVIRSASIIPQDRGNFSVMNSDEQGMDNDVPVYSRKKSSILETNTLGDEMSVEETTEDGEPEIFNQAAVDQPKTPLAKPTADTIQGHEASNNESVTAGHAMSISKTNGKGKTSEVEGSNIKENANDANCGKDKEDIADACISDGAISADSSKGIESLPQLNFQDTEETECQCNNSQSGHTMSEGCVEPTSVQSSQSWTEIELNSLFGTTVDSITPAGLKYTSRGTETLNLTMSMNRSIANSGEVEGERGSQCATTQYENVVLPTNEENQLKLLFESPIKIVDAISGRDTELDRTVMSFKECIDTIKQIESDEEVGEAGREVDKGFYPGNSSSEKGDYVTNEELKEFDSVELENNCMTMVLSEAEIDGCEASEEQFTETTCNCEEETNSVTEENKEEMIISLGSSCLYEEATENYSASTEKNIIDSSGSLRNSDKDENFTDKLIDTDLSENVSYRSRVYGISEGPMTPSSEVAGGLSDADHQKSNVLEDSHCDNSCSKDVNILRETSVDNLRGPLDPEIATCGSFEGRFPNLFSRASHNNGDITEMKDAKSIKEEGDPCEAKIWDEKDGNPRSSHDTSDELPTNSEMANFESLSVGYSLCQEAVKLTTTLQLQSTSNETTETGTTIQNIDNIVPAEEHGPSVNSAECDTLSSLVIHASQGNTENGDVELSEVESPVLDLEGDDEKNGKEIQETSSATIIPFCNEGPHFEDKVVDFNNNIQTSLDVPDSGYSEILKESDVADTIKEYIDSESSLSLHFSGSSASPPIDVLTDTSERNACENAALGESDQEDIGVLSNSKGEGDKTSVEALEAELKEPEEATTSMELARVSKKLVKSPACINLLGEGGSFCHKPSVETKGFAVNNTSEMNHRSSSKESCSTAKNKARTILIHGTPRKLMTTADMKENAATHKRSNNIGDFTTARPAKRRALQDVHWK
ncbi:UNVERIFIED_CONTAM: hypothetical protein Scaly_1550200 [Sesamum calycinum]|uniref:SAP domain-containing protein n=1 Tax=Sesamum calycinum TaxID=2727403 RepID=A0AAW2P6A3_9LAMI